MTPDFHLADAAWSGGHLLLADQDAVGKVRRKRLSASVASKTLQCPASMAASRLLPRSDDPFGDAEIGTAMHAVFEELYALPGPERTAAKIDEIVAKAASEQWSTEKLDSPTKDALRANSEARKQWIEIVGGLAHGIFRIENPPDVVVLANEQQLFVDVAGVPSVCYVDRIDWAPAAPGTKGSYTLDDLVQRRIAAEVAVAELPAEIPADDLELSRQKRDAQARRLWFANAAKVVEASGHHNGIIVVKDYKKKNKPDALKTPSPQYGDDYGDQQRLYVLAIDAFLGVLPAEAYLLFPALGGKRKIDVSPSECEKMTLAYRGAWQLMHASADRQSFETRPSALCPWCALANSCPVARVGYSQARDPLKREASILKQKKAAATQPSAVQLGIPIIRAGASPEEARTGVAPGVQVPRQPAPTGPVGPIAPVGDDLFPVTTDKVRRIPSQPVVPVNAPEPYEPPAAAPAAAEQPFVTEAVPDGLPGAREAVAEFGDMSQIDAAPRMWAEGPPVEGEQNGENPTMTQNMQIRAEGAVYDEHVNGALNLNSYAAMAVSGIVSEAFDHLSQNNQQVTGEALARFSDVLAGIVLRAQYATTGQVNFQRGAQTRLRGLLRTILPTRPAPFGRPAAEWETWMARTERFLVVALTEAMNLYERAPVQNESHLFFATDVAS